MIQHEHKRPQDTRSGHKNRSFHLLLLANNDQDWSRVVQHAASEIGDVSLQETTSVDEAMSCLVVGDPAYSHLLVESGCADARIGELAQLTQGESHNATALVMLGSGGHNPPRASVVRLASKQAVAQAIFSGDLPKRAKLPPLSLHELRAALATGQLQTRYQPIVRLSDAAPVGLEVLARLNHPTHGTLSPDHFIAQMESAGLSRRLTEEVVNRAFADYSAHLHALGLWLALNFPLDTLMDGQTLEWLDHRRQETGIPASQIIIELTESQPVDALDDGALAALRHAITRLRALGYGVALDDVGPAMPHHEALFDLDFTSAKLDKDLVHQSAHDPVAQAFVHETLALARRAGCTVVAEGVQDDATWQRMRLAGADQAQGFMVARPLPAAAVPIWMEAWQTRS